jgi:SAM-dependent methyltransferase
LEQGIIRPEDSVLDMGCGNGRNVHHLRENGVYEVVGIDNNFKADMVRIGKEMYGQDLPIEEGDMTRTRFEDHSFDVILFNSVLHFSQADESYNPEEPIPRLTDVLDEVERLARPGTRIVGSDYSNESTHPDFRRYIDEKGCLTAERIIQEFERRGYRRIDLTGPINYREVDPTEVDIEGKLGLMFVFEISS